MDAEEALKFFDYCWFELEIFKNQPRLSKLSNFEANPDRENQIQSQKQEIHRIPTIHTRSMSEDLSSKTSFMIGSLSPDSVLFSPKLQTILSGKDVTEPENPNQEQEKSSNRKKSEGRRRRGRTGSKSKSLTELEFEEVKGFMDLGFVFTEEDKNSSLASIIPGLNRLGKKEEEDEEEKEGGFHDQNEISRPYLSEAWEDLEIRNRENQSIEWRFPSLSNEIDMKDKLRLWAHSVASAVR